MHEGVEPAEGVRVVSSDRTHEGPLLKIDLDEVELPARKRRRRRRKPADGPPDAQKPAGQADPQKKRRKRRRRRRKPKGDGASS